MFPRILSDRAGRPSISMTIAKRVKWTIGAALAVVATCGVAIAAKAPGAGVDAKKIIAAAPGEWLDYGRDYSEQRFTPLDQVNTSNVKTLGLAWHYDFGDRQGLEATPLVHNGVIYVSTDFAEVFAFDARTGK